MWVLAILIFPFAVLYEIVKMNEPVSYTHLTLPTTERV